MIHIASKKITFYYQKKAILLFGHQVLHKKHKQKENQIISQKKICYHQFMINNKIEFRSIPLRFLTNKTCRHQINSPYILIYAVQHPQWVRIAG